MDETKASLTKYEIAAVTACVPCTEDPHLNKIISMSLRLKIAIEMFAAARVNGYANTRAHLVETALKDADALIKAFGSSPDAEKAKT